MKSRRRELAVVRVVIIAIVLLATQLACSAGPGTGGAAPVPSRDDQALAEPSVMASPAQTPVPTPWTSEIFWQRLAVDVDPDFITFESLDEIVDRSDAVVVGMIVGIESGPPNEDEYGNLIFTATFRIKIDTILHGKVLESSPDHLSVSKFLGLARVGDRYDFDDRFAQFERSLPMDQAIIFLLNTVAFAGRIGSEVPSDLDPTAYQLNGGQAYVRDVDGLATVPSLTGWPASLDGGSFDAAVEAVIAAGS